MVLYMDAIDFKELFQNCCDQLRQRTFQELLDADNTYQQDLLDETDLEERYRQLDLTKEQRYLINDLLACKDSRNEQSILLSYMAGVKDCISILKYREG